jgi:hypothetical protein
VSRGVPRGEAPLSTLIPLGREVFGTPQYLTSIAASALGEVKVVEVGIGQPHHHGRGYRPRQTMHLAYAALSVSHVAASNVPSLSCWLFTLFIVTALRRYGVYCIKRENTATLPLSALLVFEAVHLRLIGKAFFVRCRLLNELG